MKTEHIAQLLGVDEEQVEQWVAEGMPTEDEQETSSWLIENGKAIVDSDKIVPTYRQVALRLGVAIATVYTWAAKYPEFPGRPGHCDLDEIQAWREAKFEKKSASSNGNPRDKIAELKLRELQGEVLDKSEVARFVTSVAAAVVSSITKIEPTIEVELPTYVGEQERKTILDTVRRCVDDALDMNRDFLELGFGIIPAKDWKDAMDWVSAEISRIENDG